MPSFDIVSKVKWHEVDNALQQAQKEIVQRYDFKDTGTELEKTPEGIVIRSSSEDRVRAALSVLQDKLVKRKVSLLCTEEKDMEQTSKGGAKMLLLVKEGIEPEAARDIVKRIKDAKLKVQASIQEQQVRVTGKNRDDLQTAIALIRAAAIPLDLQYINFRD